MELSSKVALQVLIMFIYIAAGYILTRTKRFSRTGAKEATNILLLYVTPSVLINSYQGKIDAFAPSLLSGLGIAVIFTLLSHAIGILVATLLCRKTSGDNYKVDLFSSVYSNCGFMAIPILEAVLGADGVFYGSAYLAFFTILYWTHGIVTYAGDRKALSVKSLFLNPGVIGTVIALSLFLLRIKLPSIVMTAVSGMAGLNTPLSMMVLGSYLANVRIADALRRPSLYKVSLLRLIVIPVLSVLLIFALSKVFPIQPLIARAVLIPAACPVAAVAALFAARYDCDADYASEIVALTTLFSIGTIPLVIMFSSLFI